MPYTIAKLARLTGHLVNTSGNSYGYNSGYGRSRSSGGFGFGMGSGLLLGYSLGTGCINKLGSISSPLKLIF